MRYGDGGGVDQAERARREQVRQSAAELFAQGLRAVEVAARLQVSAKSAYQWRRAWVLRVWCLRARRVRTRNCRTCSWPGCPNVSNRARPRPGTAMISGGPSRGLSR
ncbi:helix-turn-helix domain-containing protein [Paractinoplanes deccanensis]|uniref:helix-turn-helix domain-containing protein n=1 Tax=Paractinoplanes deccanensis TaxID=113561 RepID=UPI001EF2FD27|nr:helix-turn-helix domain-containing protein [Actinoplanes deccanensis]